MGKRAAKVEQKPAGPLTTARRLLIVADAISHRLPLQYRDWLYDLADQIEKGVWDHYHLCIYGEWWEQASEVEGGCPL